VRENKTIDTQDAIQEGYIFRLKKRTKEFLKMMPFWK
jgi:hypothetical protein